MTPKVILPQRHVSPGCKLTPYKGNLYVASEDTNQVTGYNNAGYSFVNISLEGPVGLFFENTTNLLYMGSKSTNAVTVFNVHTGKLSSLTFSDSSLSHPAGIAVDTATSTLYVISQNKNSGNHCWLSTFHYCSANAGTILCSINV